MDARPLDEVVQPLDEDELMAMAGRLEALPLEHGEWVRRLFAECRRARAAEGALMAEAALGEGGESDVARLVLDTAEWLRTLWEVGYMGSESFPAQPRSAFPLVSVEDILKSALLARIRLGKRPLPFPPPTRDGVPWHEVVESDEVFAVRAEVSPDGWASIEGCPDWQVVGEEEPGRRYQVQHRYKGPSYDLCLSADGAATLRRRPPAIPRRIARQSRAGFDSYQLEWPKDGNGSHRIPLRADSWERAEHEAQRWVALHHPALYGQIHFERSEA